MDTLATVAELQKALQRTVDPEAGTLALRLASGIVRDYVGWSLSEETTTFVFDGSGHVLQSLPTLHLTAVAEVRLDGVPLVHAASNWPRAAEYTWSQRGQLYRPLGWPARFRVGEADVTHGYPPGQLPDAVLAVVLGLAGGVVSNPGNTLRSKTVGSVTHTYRDAPAEMTPLQALQLSGYRL
jgi:hypothetical protein